MPSKLTPILDLIARHTNVNQAFRTAVQPHPYPSLTQSMRHVAHYKRVMARTDATIAGCCCRGCCLALAKRRAV